MNLSENVGKLTMGLALVGNNLQKCSMDITFRQDPECQKIFKSSISGVTPTDTDDRFNTSCLVHYQILHRSDVVGLFAIPGTTLLTILQTIWTGGGI